MENQVKKKKLYIIGNGFDRHHGLKTSYYNFAKYLKAKDLELYNLIESYIFAPKSDNDLWWRFEENLANLDVDSIINDNDDLLPNIASDEFRDRDLHTFPDEMLNLQENLTDKLISIFTQFIRDVEMPKSAIERKIKLDNDALFFTFNYTYTLELYYRINSKNILHIHNKADDRHNNIILGHGIDPDKFKKEETPPKNLSEEELERWYENQHDKLDYSARTGQENLFQYFAKSYKSTKNIILKNQLFFKDLSEIEEIIVLGHSLGDVDLPYFTEIIKSVNSDIIWKVSYYNETEESTHRNRLSDLGIKNNNIKTIQLEDLLIDTK